MDERKGYTGLGAEPLTSGIGRHVQDSPSTRWRGHPRCEPCAATPNGCGHPCYWQTCLFLASRRLQCLLSALWFSLNWSMKHIWTPRICHWSAECRGVASFTLETAQSLQQIWSGDASHGYTWCTCIDCLHVLCKTDSRTGLAGAALHDSKSFGSHICIPDYTCIPLSSLILVASNVINVIDSHWFLIENIGPFSQFFIESPDMWSLVKPCQAYSLGFFRRTNTRSWSYDVQHSEACGKRIEMPWNGWRNPPWKIEAPPFRLRKHDGNWFSWRTNGDRSSGHCPDLISSEHCRAIQSQTSSIYRFYHVLSISPVHLRISAQFGSWLRCRWG